ncbi:MAG: TetR/AcrR family transcriptional regulator [Desulfarculus sp.]|nr:TetR/AcrR family transcriptional regulator [Pseudomonadota bacterium]MBV1716073.1 TetR/AcrR family transcriptional regulator [Desulfarculus sp.]MBU4573754.1 TetR/AcrR family transcriptional regulator [Pseudomonadota bacterium]MBU4596411.1 TetR/AcrR family transcriptional regulator [Pseudomonadota bacterium]MBV1738510.1 TetR/AcrR family transcriptional regulator [Desulfarculus sp.]
MSKSTPKSAPANPGPHSLTPKGARTRQSLLQAARQVFGEHGYSGASVSQISRECGLGQGTFYQYFRNKDQVFREVVDAALSDFWSQANALTLEGLSPHEALRRVLRLLLSHCRDYAPIHRVLNEFDIIETVTISYYDSIAWFFRDFHRRTVNLGQFRSLDPNVVAYSMLGLAIFEQRPWEDLGPAHDLEDMADLCASFLEKGISGPKAWQPPAQWPLPSPAPAQEGLLPWEESDSPGKGTKIAIFQAAEQVLGEMGYAGAGISDITRQAGVAQGTFYVHFKSKQDLMNGVVRFLSYQLRRELRRATDRHQDRRDKEVQGMLSFFRFLGRHSLIYRIVSESEAIVPQAAEFYYNKLAGGYAASLAGPVKDGEIRDLPLEIMVPALMGIHHMIGLRWLVWSAAPHPDIPKQLIDDAISLVVFGLSGR